MFPKLRKDRGCVGTSQNAINQLKICQKKIINQMIKRIQELGVGATNAFGHHNED